jgi:hypothetical protein
MGTSDGDAMKATSINPGIYTVTYGGVIVTTRGGSSSTILAT